MKEIDKIMRKILMKKNVLLRRQKSLRKKKS
jgi:hypothetical protein